MKACLPIEASITTPKVHLLHCKEWRRVIFEMCMAIKNELQQVIQCKPHADVLLALLMKDVRMSSSDPRDAHHTAAHLHAKARIDCSS